jgi:hypothetical protein
LTNSAIVDGATYVMGAAYDAYSRLSKVSCPSGFTARYGYNTLGFANQFSDDATSQSCTGPRTRERPHYLQV